MQDLTNLRIATFIYSDIIRMLGLKLMVGVEHDKMKDGRGV